MAIQSYSTDKRNVFSHSCHIKTIRNLGFCGEFRDVTERRGFRFETTPVADLNSRRTASRPDLDVRFKEYWAAKLTVRNWQVWDRRAPRPGPEVA
jgi:hypothetical protein